jgi:hypothetical protein
MSIPETWTIYIRSFSLINKSNSYSQNAGVFNFCYKEKELRGKMLGYESDLTKIKNSYKWFCLAGWEGRGEAIGN